MQQRSSSAAAAAPTGLVERRSMSLVYIYFICCCCTTTPCVRGRFYRPDVPISPGPQKHRGSNAQLFCSIKPAWRPRRVKQSVFLIEKIQEQISAKVTFLIQPIVLSFRQRKPDRKKLTRNPADTVGKNDWMALSVSSVEKVPTWSFQSTLMEEP